MSSIGTRIEDEDILAAFTSVSDEFGTGLWDPIFEESLLETRWLDLAHGLQGTGIAAPEDVHADIVVQGLVVDVQAIMKWSSPDGNLYLVEGDHSLDEEMISISPESEPAEVAQKIKQWLENGHL